MLLGFIRQLIWKFTHRQYASAEDYFRKRTKFCEFNEFVKYQAIASDADNYTLPFMTNPFRAIEEKNSWDERPSLDYEYSEDHFERDAALKHFEIVYEQLKDRVKPDEKILDVGCSTGFFLDQFAQKGFKNLHGLDPHKAAIDWGREMRPNLNLNVGFFGPKENDIKCDVLVFFQSITRVPYGDRLFDAIERCADKYVVIAWVEDSLTLFSRDFHVGLAKKGFLCIEKKVVSEKDFLPIGVEGADGPLVSIGPRGRYLPNYTSHFLFRRIEPRK
jgi:SAM-dependent methyltransferase